MNEQLKHYESKLLYEIDAADLASLVNKPSREEPVIVIDARNEDSFAVEHIPGAVSFPHKDMNAETLNSLRRDVLYITYCDGIGCNGSTKAAIKLAAAGFKVKELIGGLDWWKSDGYSTLGHHGEARNLEVYCACN